MASKMSIALLILITYYIHVSSAASAETSTNIGENNAGENTGGENTDGGNTSNENTSGENSNGGNAEDGNTGGRDNCTGINGVIDWLCLKNLFEGKNTNDAESANGGTTINPDSTNSLSNHFDLRNNINRFRNIASSFK